MFISATLKLKNLVLEGPATRGAGPDDQVKMGPAPPLFLGFRVGLYPNPAPKSLAWRGHLHNSIPGTLYLCPIPLVGRNDSFDAYESMAHRHWLVDLQRTRADMSGLEVVLGVYCVSMCACVCLCLCMSMGGSVCTSVSVGKRFGGFLCVTVYLF